ncbi:MAG: hypothetical protein JWN04_1806 [Myxococcaceae bacterium]|nr:hypothetical protein [Myxococcaceae bacterium]
MGPVRCEVRTPSWPGSQIPFGRGSSQTRVVHRPRTLRAANRTRPFWSALSNEQKERNLEHWKATPEWREAMQVFPIDPDFDAEGDARQSEHYLADMRRAREARVNKSFLRRLFSSNK